ncbi:MAG: sugar transferase [Christensenellaceae bacterium]
MHYKRLLDLLIGLIGIPFFLIVLLVFGSIIKATDNGPIFYKAERIGKNGKLFRMYKFRSMSMDAPDVRLTEGSTYNGTDDPRVTRIGKLMRAASIDEIPQILNMLNGTMILIGSRPDPHDWLDMYPEDVNVFLNARPSITGFCQAYWRNGANGEEKMHADAYYAQHISFIFDMRIFFKSIAMELKHKNTYKDMSNKDDTEKRVEAIIK